MCTAIGYYFEINSAGSRESGKYVVSNMLIYIEKYLALFIITILFYFCMDNSYIFY